LTFEEKGGKTLLVMTNLSLEGKALDVAIAGDAGGHGWRTFAQLTSFSSPGGERGQVMKASISRRVGVGSWRREAG